MRINKLLVVVLIMFFFSCVSKKAKGEKEVLSLWHHQDISLDSVYGLSLNKWYVEKPKKTKREIIVATIDSQIDLDHEDLQGQFWINKKEIANNDIDDDNNGYIDDVNGWSFIGVGKTDMLAFSKFEFVRFIERYKDKFDVADSFKHESDPIYKEYKRALAKYHKENNYYTRYLKEEGVLISAYYPAKDTLKYYFPKEDYTVKQLDSLYLLQEQNNKKFSERVDEDNQSKRTFSDLIFYMRLIKRLNFTIESMKSSSNHKDSIVNKLLNFDYDDRIKINNYQLEKGYGNNNLNSHYRLRRHNTEVASIIAANRENNKGVKGFHNNIKIMPLNISPFGDEHDKDIANAIYYAVDNGAKVINMSFSKEFSLDQYSVTKALNYAQGKNVLVVHVSGNGATDIDENPYYPSDFDYENKLKIVRNLITVGSISKRRDSTMIPFSSNYGKNNVDLFAPGEDIYVAIPDNQYDFYSGTSLAAPMVSGTAALIWLYYPNLTVQEVKNIILESGVTIDKLVVKPGTENEMVHFSKLCKTGKVLNTYNAMKMAAEVSKKK